MKPRGKAPKAKAKGKPAAKKGAKRAPVAAKSGKPPAATTKLEAITARVTPGATLKSLLSTCRGYKANSDSIISKMREEIGFAVEKKHLNKSCFADLRKYDKMEPEQAAERWHTLVRYMELSGIMAKIEAVGRLPLGDDEGEGDDAPGASDGGEAPAAEVAAKPGKSKAKNKANGDGAPALDPHPGIDPAAPVEANVSRPQFGARPAGISGDELAEAVKH